MWRFGGLGSFGLVDCVGWDLVGLVVFFVVWACCFVFCGRWDGNFVVVAGGVGCLWFDAGLVFWLLFGVALLFRVCVGLV